MITDDLHSENRRLSGVRGVRARSVRKKYLIISEGYRTEPAYFRMIRMNAPRIGIRQTVEVLPVKRCHPQCGFSDYRTILDLVEKYALELRTHRHVPDLFASEFVEKVEVRYNLSTLDSYNLFCRLAEELNKIVLEDGTLVERDATELANEFVRKELGIDLAQIFLSDIADYNDQTDKICIVIDRDESKKGGDAEKVQNFIAECENKGYSPIVSNPSFELWVLMHHRACTSDERLTTSRIIRELEEYGYDKSRTDFFDYVKQVNNAILNSKELCTDVRELGLKFGTNIGVLIEEMKQNSQ